MKEHPYRDYSFTSHIWLSSSLGIRGRTARSEGLQEWLRD